MEGDLCCGCVVVFFFFQAEDGIRGLVRSRGLGDVYKRQVRGRTWRSWVGPWADREKTEGDRAMTNKESILEFLEANAPGGYCDDCLSEQLHIEPRQQVNQLCNGLAHQMRLARAKANCVGCGRNKTCNTLTAVPGEMLGELKATLYRRTSDALEVETPVSMEMRLEPVSYTHLRAHETVLDLVCRLLLEKKKQKNKKQ